MTHSIVRARNFLSAWWLALKVFGRNSLGRRFEREVPYLRYAIGPEDVCLHVGASDGRLAQGYRMFRVEQGALVAGTAMPPAAG